MLPGKDGTALYSHYKTLRDDGVIVPELLEYEQLEIPFELVGYWNDFVDLSNRRQMNDSGPCSLSFQEMVAWSFLHSITPTPIQTMVIFLLDDIWMEERNKKNST